MTDLTVPAARGSPHKEPRDDPQDHRHRPRHPRRSRRPDRRGRAPPRPAAARPPRPGLPRRLGRPRHRRAGRSGHCAGRDGAHRHERVPRGPPARGGRGRGRPRDGPSASGPCAAPSPSTAPTDLADAPVLAALPGFGGPRLDPVPVPAPKSHALQRLDLAARSPAGRHRRRQAPPDRSDPPGIAGPGAGAAGPRDAPLPGSAATPARSRGGAGRAPIHHRPAHRSACERELPPQRPLRRRPRRGPAPRRPRGTRPAPGSCRLRRAPGRDRRRGRQRGAACRGRGQSRAPHRRALRRAPAR